MDEYLLNIFRKNTTVKSRYHITLLIKERRVILPAYKDEKKNTWYCSFLYTNWNGDRKRKLKRGFALKKDALEWERQFLSKAKMSCDMTFNSLTDLYFDDMANRLKSSTLSNKRYLFDTKIIPFFGKLSINKITPAHIRKWQNELIGNKNGYSPTYLKTINNQLSAVFNYGIKYYNLASNPCRIAGTIGKKDADKMHIWTVNEFKKAMTLCNRKSDRVAFEIMFYGGLRIGEVLALTPSDILESKAAISITKSYTRLNGEDVISSPKTPKSIRVVTIPQFLLENIINYINSIYDITSDTRIFNYGKGTLNRALKKCAKAAELPFIRVHDLRHSHASLLIEMGYNILLISERLGHEKVDTTWNTYAHLYPDKQEKLAEDLQQFK